MWGMDGARAANPPGFDGAGYPTLQGRRVMVRRVRHASHETRARASHSERLRRRPSVARTGAVWSGVGKRGYLSVRAASATAASGLHDRLWRSGLRWAGRWREVRLTTTDSVPMRHTRCGMGFRERTLSLCPAQYPGFIRADGARQQGSRFRPCCRRHGVPFSAVPRHGRSDGMCFFVRQRTDWLVGPPWLQRTENQALRGDEHRILSDDGAAPIPPALG